jgi:hypothetical protein
MDAAKVLWYVSKLYFSGLKNAKIRQAKNTVKLSVTIAAFFSLAKFCQKEKFKK